MGASATSLPDGTDVVTPVCAAIRRASLGYGALKRLAFRSGIPAQTLRRYRSGEREPRWSDIQKLSDADEAIRAEIVRLLLEKDPDTRARLMRTIEERP